MVQSARARLSRCGLVRPGRCTLRTAWGTALCPGTPCRSDATAWPFPPACSRLAETGTTNDGMPPATSLRAHRGRRKLSLGAPGQCRATHGTVLPGVRIGEGRIYRHRGALDGRDARYEACRVPRRSRAPVGE